MGPRSSAIHHQVAGALRYLACKSGSPLACGALLLGCTICRRLPAEGSTALDRQLGQRDQQTLTMLLSLESKAEQQGLRTLHTVLAELSTLWMAATAAAKEELDRAAELFVVDIGSQPMSVRRQIEVTLQELGLRTERPLEASVLLFGSLLCGGMSDEETGTVEDGKASEAVLNVLQALKYLEAEALRHNEDTLHAVLYAVTAIWMAAKYADETETQPIAASILNRDEPRTAKRAGSRH